MKMITIHLGAIVFQLSFALSTIHQQFYIYLRVKIFININNNNIFIIF